MTRYIQGLLDYFIKQKGHHKYRQGKSDPYQLAKGFKEQKLPDLQRVVKRFAYMLEQEKPVVLPNEKIALIRTTVTVPEIFTQEELDEIRSEHYIHEQGKVCNINPGYSNLIDVGFTQKREEINGQIRMFREEAAPEKAEYLESMLAVMDAIESFVERYRQEAFRAGNTIVAAMLERIPENRPSNFHEALQFFRILHYCLWCSFNYHNTIGRFDQYMLPYLQRDLQEGRLNEEQALELLEEFFTSFNKDSDLYTGMQQGDNGQSLMLGGLNPDGSDSYNLLSDLCLRASMELKLIDPKINLRVHKGTDLSLYEKATHLTKLGLGFPQYSNDDVVIPAMMKWGYEKEDAFNYTVAACWEFIVPDKAMDIPNISALSFTEAVLRSLHQWNARSNFEELMDDVRVEIDRIAQELMNNVKNIYMEPSPLMSLMCKGCVESGKDISLGSKYNNYGIHGTGLSTAVDSLAAIKRFIFGEKTISMEELLSAVDKDFAGNELLLNKLRYSEWKLGNDIDEVDVLACRLLDWFADALEGKRNDRGGIFRPGTGSAMYYIWHSKEVQATPDGRRKGEALACNYSPGLFTRCKGPVSIVKSFSKPDLQRVANGGPLTLELHDTVFRSEDSIRKVAMLVKSYMNMGGHQMQLNAVNRDRLIDAKKHPENYRNLIVRVWGWSGYFTELDEVYQDHIIKRTEFMM
jgi:formate C-acetyltransferase